MKAVILAGGFGTRLSEETDLKPKPLVEIGGKPIIWHILKIYSHFGINEFIVCCGYKGYLLKEYFANYFMHTSDITFDISKNTMEVHGKRAEPWKVTLIDTGDATMTGGRIKRIEDHVKNEELFCLTYGDGVANIDIDTLIAFHKKHGKLATLTSVSPPGRYGILDIENNKVINFAEKPKGDGAEINGGFFVLSPKAIDYIEGDETIWERQPMENLSNNGELMAYRHAGFWQAMDTLRDKRYLEDLWKEDSPPWKLWS